MASIDFEPFAETHRPDLERLADQMVRDGTVFPHEDVPAVFDYWFSPGAEVWVARCEGQIAGTYTLKPNGVHRLSHIANGGYMVFEEMRGRGIGLALGEHSMGVARERGYRAMQFNAVVASNGSAIRLWERLGFRVIGRSPGAFRHPDGSYVDLCIMFQELVEQ